MTSGGLATRALQRWVQLVMAWPRTTWVVLVALTIGAAWVSVDRYAMNSRLGDLVQQEADWRVHYDDFRLAFPQLIETAIVVVRGSSFAEVEQASMRLEAAIGARDDLFKDVFAPANDAFFRDNALLLMSLPQLDDLGDALAQAQPMLTAVAEDPSLRGVFDLIGTAASNGAQESVSATADLGLARVVELITTAAQAALEGVTAPVPWTDEFFPPGAEPFYRLIFLRGVQNYGAALPNERIVAELRTLIAAQALPDTVTVALTGEVALQHEEVRAATGGVQIAGGVALLLLLGVLIFGVRSARIIGATFLLLSVGALWTSGLAMLTVGEYNTLSLVFVVMFFGLGVDFAVHFCLRVQEAGFSQGMAPGPRAAAAACATATHSVGGAITLCTATTAIGFLGFVPTPYQGLADLGVISAGGMAVACVLTFTLLPVYFRTFGLPVARELELRRGATLVASLIRHRKPVLLVGLLLTVLAASFAGRMQFDYSVLALRDPSAESMRTLRELQRQGEVTDYALFVLAADPRDPRLARLEGLPVVASVTTPFDHVPTDQATKLAVLADLQFVLGSALAPSHTESAPVPAELATRLPVLQQQLATSQPADLRLQNAFDNLAEVLGRVRTAPPEVLARWQAAVLPNLLAELNWLRRALQAGPIEFADLPAALRERLVTPDGRYLTTVLPSEDIAPVAALNRFITTVREQVDTATGRPVVEWGVGNIVVHSFRTALLVALLGIGLLLLVTLRSVRDTLLVLTPLALTAIFTVATSVLLQQPINMASVLVLPLIFGLGVDNGIHMVKRYHHSLENVGEFMHSSTPRAVLLSTLTTIGTFAALLLSPHQGTASIGFLLTVAVGYLLLFTVFLLPVLLSLTLRHTQPTGADELA